MAYARPHDHPHDPLDPVPTGPVASGGGSLPLRVGIGGPVGSGKTALIAAVCRALHPRRSVGVITNDIYTTEDADRLRADAVLADDRIVAVRTGCCPHTAVRDDVTANLDAFEGLVAAHGDLDLVLFESGGDNLTLTWSQALVDHEVFVLDVAGGDDVPRKGGPGVSGADLLVINKTDLAPYVGADLASMASDAAGVRDGRDTLLVSLAEAGGAHEVSRWIDRRLDARSVAASPARS